MNLISNEIEINKNESGCIEWSMPSFSTKRMEIFVGVIVNGFEFTLEPQTLVDWSKIPYSGKLSLIATAVLAIIGTYIYNQIFGYHNVWKDILGPLGAFSLAIIFPAFLIDAFLTHFKRKSYFSKMMASIK